MCLFHTCNKNMSFKYFEIYIFNKASHLIILLIWKLKYLIDIKIEK